jgi:hypothetical protein
MNNVKPSPMRGAFTFAGVVATGVEPFFVATVAPEEFVVAAFGRRRLGFVAGAGLVPLPVALGRVVRNAPRTSSSRWAEASAGIKPARASKMLKKMTFILICYKFSFETNTNLRL